MNSVSTPVKPVAKWTPFGSTNFTLQMFMPLLLAIGLALGIPEDFTTQVITFIGATFVGGVGFWGTIREFFKDGFSLVWNSNIATYVVAFASGLVPWIASYDFQGSIGQLVDGIVSGNINLIFAAVFALANIIYRLTQDKPWVTPEEEPTPAA